MAKESLDLNHLAKAEFVYAVIFSFILPLLGVLRLSFDPEFLVLSFAYNVQTIFLSFIFYYILLHIFSHHAIMKRSWNTVFSWHGEGQSKHKFWIADIVTLLFAIGVYFYFKPMGQPNSLEVLGFLKLFYTAALISLPVNIIMRKFFNYRWSTNIITSIVLSPIYALFIIAINTLR